MTTITVSGLVLKFDKDAVHEGSPLDQAKEMVRDINEAMSVTDGSPCLMYVDGIREDEVTVEEEGED